MIFHQWKDISNSNNNTRNIWTKTENLYIVVDNDYKLYNDIDQNTNLYDISELGKYLSLNNYTKVMEFIDNSQPNLLIYYKLDKSISDDFKTFIFLKNKFYKFSFFDDWYDEMGININHNDIWYDPFLFVFEKDLHIANRYLKLNNLRNENKY